MIHKFSVKNFFSFKDAVEVNFVVNEHAPDTTAYVLDGDTRISKLLSFVGPNASGKTNILRVLPFVHFLIVDSFVDLKPNEEIPVEIYKFTSKKDTPLEISVTFSNKNNLYEYTAHLNKKQFFYEQLRKYSPITKQFSILFKREWSKESNQYKYTFKDFSVPPKFELIVRKNASVLATGGQLNHALSKDLINYWELINSNVAYFGKYNHLEAIPEAAKYYFEHPEEKSQAENLLTRFDLGLAGLQIEQHFIKMKSGKEEPFYFPTGLHKVNGKNYPLEFYLESQGTQTLFKILRDILPILKTGGIVILDEFDADLHPHMLPELIDLFLSEELNPNNAQLIFSTHHHEILNKLDKYQINILEKDGETGVSDIWRLDDLGIRSDDNYYTKYIAGAYGGVPNL